MVRYLIQRPVAVLMCFFALVLTGLLLIGKVPVSLLPEITVPQIVVRVTHPSTPAREIEDNILKPLRAGLGSLNGLVNITSSASDHGGLVYLDFDYGTAMDLAFIEVNEKVDRLTNLFPRGMERPQINHVNASDIPVVRLQVVPKNAGDFLAVSALAENIIKKRLEQLPGISVVDINGAQHPLITVQPNEDKLAALGISSSVIAQAIENGNVHLGGLSVKDGQYRYFVTLANRLASAADIAALPIRLSNGTVIKLERLAEVTETQEPPMGYHLFNGQKSLVLAIQKQPDSRMNELMPRIIAAKQGLEKDYPEAGFYFTQDQTFLMDAGISNLYQDLLLGGALTVLLLFMFLGNWASPVLMSISIPLSLIITFIFFYLFKISFNIISLSGLALGIGMLIDNSIVVVDNISRKHREQLTRLESAIAGTNEVIGPVISQVLTTVAVYAPLILFSGIAGALVYDQSIALTISLGVSLLVAFVLTPVLYKLLMRDTKVKYKDETLIFLWVSRRYHVMIDHILRFPRSYIAVTIIVMPLGFLLIKELPVASLPKIEKKETLLKINWNEPIEVEENLRRSQILMYNIHNQVNVTEADIGIRQLLAGQQPGSVQESEIYFACSSEEKKIHTNTMVAGWLQANFPLATAQYQDAPNAFTQLFQSSQPYFEMRFQHQDVIRTDFGYSDLEMVLAGLPNQDFQAGPGLAGNTTLAISIDNQKLAIYGVPRNSLEATLRQIFGSQVLTAIDEGTRQRYVQLAYDRAGLEAKLNAAVANSAGALYAVRQFLHVRFAEQPRTIAADLNGIYQSVSYDKIPAKDIAGFRSKVERLSAEQGMTVRFVGQYFGDQERLWLLVKIFAVVLLLLYLILAIQYENLLLPLIVMLTIPLGISGGMLGLWLTGQSLNVMSAIGFVVILGLIVDDPILKIETLKRLAARNRQQRLPHDAYHLKAMIHEAGSICLKPLLMVSLTTSIAMLPVLFIGGIGNELQKPLAVVIIGGLTIGTFFTTWFIPLAYWYLQRWLAK